MIRLKAFLCLVLRCCVPKFHMPKVKATEAKNESNQESTSNQSVTEPIEKFISIQSIITSIKIDLLKLLEYGDSPTAIILSMAIFTAILLLFH